MPPRVFVIFCNSAKLTAIKLQDDKERLYRVLVRLEAIERNLIHSMLEAHDLDSEHDVEHKVKNVAFLFAAVFDRGVQLFMSHTTNRCENSKIRSKTSRLTFCRIPSGMLVGVVSNATNSPLV